MCSEPKKHAVVIDYWIRCCYKTRKEEIRKMSIEQDTSILTIVEIKLKWYGHVRRSRRRKQNAGSKDLGMTYDDKFPSV